MMMFACDDPVGINRKAQLKWTHLAESDRVGVLIVLKWGGVLTHSGVQQSQELGKWFRSHLYPGESTGLLRLHSYFRHDVKIYSSDEGRVQMTAAAFAKGLLDLDGDLTPILASLVRSFNTNDMLDDTRCARGEQNDMKERLSVVITREALAPAVAAGAYPALCACMALCVCLRVCVISAVVVQTHRRPILTRQPPRASFCPC